MKQIWIVCMVSCLWLVMGCQSNQPSVSELQKDLAKQDWLRSRNAAELLPSLGTNALPVLLQALKHSSPQTRMFAAEALATFAKSQETHSQALSELLQALRDKHALVRRRTAETLASYAANPVDTDGLILALLESMRKDKDLQVRQYAARALGSLKVSTKNKSSIERVLSALFHHLHKQHPFVTVDVAYALFRLLQQQQALIKDGTKKEIKALADKQKRTLDALVRVLETGDTWSKASAAHVLGILGVGALPAIPALRKAMLSPHAVVFHNAATALGKIGDKAFVPLKKDMADKSPLVRRRAAYAFSQMASSAKDAVHALERLLKSEKDPSVKAMARFSRDFLKSRHHL